MTAAGLDLMEPLGIALDLRDEKVRAAQGCLDLNAVISRYTVITNRN